MTAKAITAEGLGKRFTIGEAKTSWSLRDSFDEAFTRRRRPDQRRRRETIWALLDVTFQVPEGAVVGVIGRNGAGKSTLLKILSRIIEPTTGRAVVEGRVGSLLEVGTGFHADLTGRENTYLSGAILGMRRREIGSKFDEIIAFAEVEKFVDTPVKHYSSGMYLRLAFAVAAHLEPEVLLIDEVLAVGDAAFQKKCLGKMGEVAQRGRTVLFVSHNLAAVRKLCPTSMLLSHGKLVELGPSHDVVRIYTKSSSEEHEGFDRSKRQHRSEEAEIVGAWVEQEGYRSSTLTSGLPISIGISITVRRRVRLSAEVLLRDADGIPILFCPGGLAKGQEFDLEPGDYQLIGQSSALPAAEGRYSLDLMLAETNARFLDYLESALSFDVGPTAIGPRTWAFRQSRGQGSLHWSVDFSCQAAEPRTEGGRSPDSAR